MADLEKVLASLSPEKRALLEKKIKEKGKSFNSFPLSYSQRRLWFLEKLDNESTAYTIPTAIRFHGNLKIDLLKISFEKIIERHEVLRTKIVTIKEEPIQVVTKNNTLMFNQIDLSKSEQKDDQFRKSFYADVANPFSLNNDRLFRISLYKFDKNEYILTLLMHHIISDGWSVGIFIRELTEIYNSLLNNKEAILPKLTIQYADFAKWQEKWRNSSNFKEHLEYWKEKLKSVPEKLHLPIDFPRPLMKNFKGKVISSKIDKEIVEKINSITKHENITMFMFLISVYKVMLNKITGQDDLSIGTPIANRNKSDIENLIGFFVNTLVVRSKIKDELNFLEFLQTTRTTLLEAYSHQEIPFEYLVEILNPERDLSTTPIFQTMFVYQPTDNQKLNLQDVKVSPYKIENTTAKFDLTLMVNEAENGEMEISFEYDTDLFKQSTVERMLEYFKNILTEIVVDPLKLLINISFIGEKEYKRIVNSWSQLKRTLNKTKLVTHHIEEQVLRNSNAIALVSNTDKYTYKQLNQKANAIAKIIQEKGFVENDFIGVFMDRSNEMISVLLGILKSGNAYLPLDVSLPNERIKFMLVDTKTKVVFTDNNNFNKLPKGIEKINIDINHIDPKIENLNIKIHPQQVAYIIYTSGSTGIPKGVTVTHQNMLNLIEWGISAFEKDLFKGMLLSTSMNFDVSVFELFVTLCKGGSVTLSENILELFESTNLNQISTISTVPSAIVELVKSNKFPEHIKYIHLAGEYLPMETVNSLYEFTNVKKVYDLYGPTENTVYSTFKHRLANESSLIGKAITNVETYILDKRAYPVPYGFPGELYLGGEGVTQGYFNRPKLTAEKFLPNPFSNATGARMYKTGDIVRLKDNGNIEYTGRIDHQVKIRGYRIELGEIESAMRDIKNINNSLVIIYQTKAGDKNIVAYYTSRIKLDISYLKNELSEKIPNYMVPSLFVFMEKFPILPSGKIDRKNLPNPLNIKRNRNIKFIKPKGDVEKKLANIWAKLLNIKNVSRNDNFFEIGGHSLLATRVITRIKDELNVDLQLKLIFEKPTIEEMARAIDNTKIISSRVKIEKLQNNEKKQLSYAQERLWFLDQLEPGNSAYNIPSVIKLKGKVNLDIFNYAFNEIIKRHEVLRSTIKTVDGNSELIIEEVIDFVVDVVKLDASISKNEIEKIVNKESFKPFRLDKAPLLRAKMLILNNDEFIFILTLHHIISDGWSAGIFIREFGEIYKSKLIGKTALLPKLDIQYSEYAAWQKKWLQGDILEKQINYWENQLAGIPPLINLPTNCTRPPIQTFNGALQNFEIRSEIAEQLSIIAKENNATIFMVLLAILQTLLHRYSGHDDICIGTPVANRNRVEIENLIGFFINTIVIRGDLSGAPTFSRLLERIRETSIKAMEHQDIPFEKLIDTLKIERSVSHSPVFQVMFTFQNLPENKINLPDLTLEQFPLESKNAKFDLSITMTELPNGMLTGAFEYNTDLFYSSTIKKMVNHFETLINAISVSPNVSIDQIDFVSNYEKQLLLKEWIKTKIEIPSILLLHELFEDTVRNKPNIPAIIYKGSSLTFQELNEKANQLANYLISKNISQESIVGICLNRSVEIMVSIIAVWKAGCAYVPIDPELPEDRVQHIIKDSKAKIIISTNEISNRFSKNISNKLLIDDHWHLVGKESTSNISLSIFSSNLAYIIYTSGSTGTPKGVMVEHCSAINLAMELNNTIYKWNNENVISLNAPISFDASVQQIVMMLYGNTLNIIPQEVRLDGEALVNYITKNKIDVLDCVPTQLSMMIENNLFANSEWKPSIILPGGEAVNQEMWRMICENDDIQFFNMYGPTECTVDSTICEITKIINKPSIGKPINNNTHFVLDKNLQIVPIGVAGELFIGGKGVSRGYLNNPILTAEKYVPNPFNQDIGDRLYKTGDLVRYLSDGNLEYLGRVDHQVKLRGFRIELGEIESLLKSHSKIKESVVIVRDDEPNIKRLVAYFVPIENVTISIKEIRDFLVAKLPSYMVPTQIIQLDTIPLTQTGKINRSILPKPVAEKIEVNNKYEEPKTKNEIILAEAIQQVLNIEKVGVHDNFFELGGDSIIGIQVISKAKQAGLKITPVQLFQYQTIHKLAAIATKVKTTRAEQGIITGSFNFSPIQMSFIEKNYEHRNHWNQSLLFKLNRKLDANLLLKTVKKVSTHHDALRIRLSELDDFDQLILPEFDTSSFEIIDLSNEQGAAKEKIESKCQETQNSLNLMEGPIFKILYFQLSGNEGRMLFVFHHMVIDGVSWRILLEDFQLIYNSFDKNIEYDFPAKTTSFKEWTRLLTKHAGSTLIQNEKQYWIDKAEIYEDSLQLDFKEGLNDEESARSISRTLNEEQTTKLLKEVNKKYNTKIDDILLTALVLSYSQWSGKRSVFLNLEGHGRNNISDEIDLSRTIGWFTTIYPLHLELKKAVSTGDSIKVIKEQIREIPNDGLGYGILRHLTDDNELKNKLKNLDNIGITFNYLGQFDNILSNESIFEPANENKGFDRALINKRSSLIDISGNIFTNQFRIIFNYSTNLFKDESMNEWINLYIKNLEKIILDCTSETKATFTSSDFELSNLNDKKLDKVLAKLKKK